MDRPLHTVSPWLDVLEAHRATLVEALAVQVDDRTVDQAHRLSARLSVRLDASPLDDATAAAVDDGTHAAASVAATTASTSNGQVPSGSRGWADALRLDGMPTQDIAAIEYQGVRAAQQTESELARGIFDAPVTTLSQIHRLIAGGLVDSGRLGALRQTSRALHDGGQGRVIFHAPPPERLPELMRGLDAWLANDARDLPPLAAAGVVHFHLLHWRPFEAGNGRVARIASRVVLRALGADPWGLAVPEETYDAAPLRYADEVAATVRRRGDLRRWNERTAEAIVASLERTARALRAVPTGLDARAVRVALALQHGDTVTVPQIVAKTDLDLNSAAEQCNLLCWAGVLRRDPGTQGLRYVREATDVSSRSGGKRWR